MMIYIALAEYMKLHPEYYERMVAAYMLGNAPTGTWLAENSHVKVAAGAGDTGVLVSWNTEGEANIGQTNMVVPPGSVCINPLNWKTDGSYAGIGENLGSLVPDGGTGTYKLVAGLADARIEVGRGSVICSTVSSADYAMSGEMVVLFGPESYHGYDFGFYYLNIRQNAELRIANFLQSHADNGGSSSCRSGVGGFFALLTLPALWYLRLRVQ